MWLIVGLGNPGLKYAITRHNVGFMALDFLAKAIGVKTDDAKSEHKAHTVSFNWETTPVKFVKPQNYMNLSGESVAPLMNFYKVALENVVVVVDDMDQPFGQIRIKSKSGDGGHNGLKSLIQQLGTNEFVRVKIGIGRSPIAGMDPADWVLQKFSKSEQDQMPEVLNTVADALEMIVFEGPTKAMNTFNTSKKD